MSAIADVDTPPQRRRKWDTGRERPYRACPPDFRETYIRLGWETIVEHYSANWRIIARWIDETGREELTAARAEYVRAHGKRWLHPVR